MYSKINKIISVMKECKDKYKECGRLKIKNYDHAITDNGLKARIHRQYKVVADLEKEIESMEKLQRGYTMMGDIEESLACQFAISKLSKRRMKEKEKLVRLQIQYKDVMQYNNSVQEEIKRRD